MCQPIRLHRGPGLADQQEPPAHWTRSGPLFDAAVGVGWNRVGDDQNRPLVIIKASGAGRRTGSEACRRGDPSQHVECIGCTVLRRHGLELGSLAVHSEGRHVAAVAHAAVDPQSDLGQHLQKPAAAVRCHRCTGVETQCDPVRGTRDLTSLAQPSRRTKCSLRQRGQVGIQGGIVHLQGPNHQHLVAATGYFGQLDLVERAEIGLLAEDLGGPSLDAGAEGGLDDRVLRELASRRVCDQTHRRSHFGDHHFGVAQAQNGDLGSGAVHHLDPRRAAAVQGEFDLQLPSFDRGRTRFRQVLDGHVIPPGPDS